MKGRALHISAVLAFAAAAAWALAELVASNSLGGLAVFLPIWIVALVGTIAAPRLDRLAWERGSRAALGVTFFANRIVLLGPEVVAMSAFLALLVGVAIVQRFDRMFGRAYRGAVGVTATGAMDRALLVGLGRASGAVGLSLVLALVASSAIVAGFLPLTRALTVLVLVLLLIGVIAWLARMPQAAEASPPPGPRNV